MLGLGEEATAAIVGAAVGSVLAFGAQYAVLRVEARRRRRGAAQIIFGELVIGLSEAAAAIDTGHWASPSGAPSKAAWEAYGVHLMGGGGIRRLAHIASAYGRLNDLAWSAQHGIIGDHPELNAQAIRTIRLGLVEAGRVAGLSDIELENRLLLDDDVRAHEAALLDQYERGRQRQT